MNLRRVTLIGVMLIAPGWSIHSLFNLHSSVTMHGIFDSTFSMVETQVLIHSLVCLLALWIAIEMCVQVRHSRNCGEGEPIVVWKSNRLRVTLLGLLAVAAQGSTDTTHQQAVASETTIPVTALLSPSIATLLLKEILQRRREQIRNRQVPDLLTEDESISLSTVCEIADRDTDHELEGILDESIPIVSELLAAVERPQPAFKSCNEEFENSLIVRVYGYPEVKAVNGQRAEFRKKRALELVVWLSLNRERPRRSAARTALWQVGVNDSTFSTIVSDMRRGMADIGLPIGRAELVPTTYTDELILNPCVVTDYDILVRALRLFRENQSQWGQLRNALQEVRDVPLSGTSYEWADLDGTTTRLIITAIQAAQELAEYAVVMNDADLMMTAVSAGLRVLPGCEELLNIQDSFVRGINRPTTIV